ncbi:MAG: CBS domain-containing protein [Caldilineaceae bacterium]|nr:CBS domain-containing protein [Caldilineaceae bacterium]MCB9136834.1 CBS domain-containing protein [Caldilineaceae bacterium]
MLVRDKMSAPAQTIRPDTPFQDAVKLMREHNYRRLPVVNDKNELIGIVSERDLLHASPSPATSLSIWEMNYLLWKLKIEELMTRKVISVSPDTPIEEAAHLMVSRKIGGLPVVDDGNHVVGVITETDIFQVFTEMLGSGEHGLRLTLKVPSGSGTLAKLSRVIMDQGGYIVSVGSLDRESDTTRRVVVKVRGVAKDTLIGALEEIGDRVVDAREV